MFSCLEPCETSGMYNPVCFLFFVTWGPLNPIDRFLSNDFLQTLLLHRVGNSLALCSRISASIAVCSFVGNLTKLQGCIILYVYYFVLPGVLESC